MTAPTCTNCHNPRVAVFRRGVCRTCYRKLGLSSLHLASKAAGEESKALKRSEREAAKTGVPTHSNKFQHGGPEARTEAMRMLCEGYQVNAVAAQIGVTRFTVMDWRDSPEGQSALAEARKAREESFKGALENSRRLLREGQALAAQTLLDNLRSPRAATRTAAALAILDRTGLPSSLKNEITVTVSHDLSKLTDEELAALQALTEKAEAT